MRNSFKDVQRWVQGEIYDTESYKAAIDHRNALNEKAGALKKKNTSTQKDIELLNLDKKSVNTLFKSKSDVGNLENKVTSR